MHALRLATKLDGRAAEVDLQLLARRGLVAHRCHRFGAQLEAQRLDDALHSAQADLDPELTRQDLSLFAAGFLRAHQAITAGEAGAALIDVAKAKRFWKR